MKNRIALISLLALIALSFSTYAAFAYEGHGGRGFMGTHWKGVLSKSGVPLTDEQKVQIKGIFQQNRDQFKETRTALIQARRDLRTSVLSGQQTDDQIKGRVDDTIMPLIAKMAETRAVIHNQIVWTVLTAEQRAALQAHAASKKVQE